MAEDDDAQKSAVLEQESDTVQRAIYAGFPPIEAHRDHFTGNVGRHNMSTSYAIHW